MKKLGVILFALGCLTFQQGFAQPGRGNRANLRQQIEAQKVAFITQKVGLTPKEAEKFWPVYNEYQSELKAIRKGKVKNLVNLYMSDSTLTDAQIDEAINGHFDNQQQELDIERKYYGQFKQILPMDKVAKFYIAQEQFKRELLKRLRNEGRQNNQ